MGAEMNIPQMILDNFWATGEVPDIPNIGEEFYQALAAHIWQNIPRQIAVQRELWALDYVGRMSGGITRSSKDRQNLLTRILVNAGLLQTRYPVRRWHGLLLREGSEMMEAFILESAPSYPTSEQLNFLGARDRDGHYGSVVFVDDRYQERITAFREGRNAPPVPTEHQATAQDIRLAEAFQRQMLAEVQSSRHARPFVGEFVMQKIPFPTLDEYIAYDHLRLIVTGWGLWFSFVGESDYLFCWWRPDIDGIDMAFGSKSGWMVRVLMACIWRDACIVQKSFVTERTRSEYTRKARHHQKTKIVLPRHIREVAWSQDEERERIIHVTHYVRGHYRELHEGYMPSENAVLNARSYGFADPPDGFTFVQPHIRGSGDVALPIAKEVVCKGLQAARTALSHFE